MSNYKNVSIKGRTFRVRAGDVLLDGALANGVDIPHDCRAGTCGTCMVQVVKGQTVCGETHTQGMVHACQARVVSDLEVEMEDVPEIDTTRARLTGLRELAPDILELTIAPEKSISYLPGQYFRFAFNGFPARAFSPTAAFDGRIGGRVIHLNVKRVRGGRVSSCSRHHDTAGTPAAYARPVWAGFPASRRQRPADTGGKRYRLRSDMGHRLHGAARIQGPPHCHDRRRTPVIRALHEAGTGAACPHAQRENHPDD